jgi:hypothetical protein
MAHQIQKIIFFDREIQKIIVSTITTSKNIIIPSNLKDNCDDNHNFKI